MKSLSVKLGVFLIALTIFGYAEAWGAECAWVLWTKTEASVKNKGLDVRWELIGAVPKYEQCVNMLKSTYQNYKKAWLGTEIDSKEKANDEKFILLPFLGYSIQFYCFPDTVDPRK
jgi:hypothetical protein